MNPLDMTGPSFLTFYLSLLAGAVAMAAALGGRYASLIVAQNPRTWPSIRTRSPT